MADILVDGRTKVTYVATLTDPLAPTATALNAGMDLQDRLIAAGLEGFDPSTAEVDNTSLASTFGTKFPGRPEYSGTALVIKNSTGTDTVKDTLGTFGVTGYIAIRDGSLNTVDWAAADVAHIYPITTGYSFTIGRGEANSLLRTRIPISISAQPTDADVV